MPDLLIELYSEEIPARMQAQAARDLRRLVADALVEAGLTYAHAGAFATPRRLTLALEGLPGESPTTREERRGPRADAPDKAVEGFLRATGLTRDQLELRDDRKGQVWFAVLDRSGRPAEAIVAEGLDRVIRDFPWPKSMRWGAGALRWVRPLHRILCILSDEGGHRVVPVTIDGLAAGDVTEGHRFMAPGAVPVTSFEDYAAKLKRAKVILSAEERAETIWNDVTQAAFALGLEPVEDRALLDEVAGLVEWPVVLTGQIAPEFLDLPPEVLQTSMREHQKFFSLKSYETGVPNVQNVQNSGQITRFVTVANRETADNGATILAGNQKVLSARLSDAKFFWENDLRVARNNMKEWLQSLENVTFHARLGTQAERVERIKALAREIAPLVGADPGLAEQAAAVAKADLTSEMVYEFPELQGVMGRYYSTAAGFPDSVASAAEAHYRPLGPKDSVPTDPVAIAVALADKLDMLTGFWAINEKPTGSKDPFALRRAALGVIRLVLENGLRICLSDRIVTGYSNLVWPLIRTGQICFYGRIWDDPQHDVKLRHFFDGGFGELDGEFLGWKRFDAEAEAKQVMCLEDQLSENNQWSWTPPARHALLTQLLTFLHDRLKVFLRDRGIRHDVIDACLAMPGNDDLTLLVRRAEALDETLRTDDGGNLIQGFKRASNILAQAEENDGVEYSFGADLKFAEAQEERALFAALDAADAKIAPALQAEDFAAAMTAMAALRGPIDAFFDAVQVNADNQILRRNRLNMLNGIRRTCLSVADLTRLEG